MKGGDTSAPSSKPDINIRERDVEKEMEKQSLPHSTPPAVIPSKPTQSKEGDGGYVGFASLPNQVYRKSVKRGFEFTLMVVG